MNTECIMIEKKPGIKNCIRINTKEDVPDFLKDSIRIKDNQLILDCIEGEQTVPTGSVVAYEKLQNGKMNVWNKANWKETTREVNGVFYEIVRPYQAVRVTENVPSFVVEGLGNRFHILEDGTYQIDTDWGVSYCSPNNGYFVIYGKKDDGTLDINVLTKGTPSFLEYYVLNENGDFVQTLEEYDEQFEESKSFQK